MPLRLIGTLAVLVVLLFFIGFNVENTCDLSLGFHTFKNVPVFLTVFASFILGTFFSLPFFFFRKRPKKAKSAGAGEKQLKDNKSPKEEGSEAGEVVAEAPKESPYGID